MEAAKVIAGLTRMVRDVGLAEDFAQEALLAALQQWPESGIPANPGAWLMAAGKRRAIDHFRSHRAHRDESTKKSAGTCSIWNGRRLISTSRSTIRIGDDLLRLIFIACHPDPRPLRRAPR